MNNFSVNPIRYLKGEIKLPPDKSIFHRALILSSIAQGKSVIKKIAIPIAGDRLFPSFGQATEFAIFHIQNQQIIKKEILHPPPRAPDVFPDWLHDLGVSVIIAGNMGSRAMENFKAKGTTVITGSSTTSPDELVQQHLSRNR